MTKISALSDIGTSVASNDAFVLVDVSDPTTPNKKIQQQNLLAAGGLLPDGSAGTPGLRFTSDTNVGLFRPTTDTLGFATGGSERLRIDSSGRVGIGTSSPINTLHVNGTGGGSFTSGFADALALINATTNTAGQGAALALTALATKETAWIISAEHTSGNNGDLAFYGYPGGASYAERMRITSAGNVGIGTASPASILHCASTGDNNIRVVANGATAQLGVDGGAPFVGTNSGPFNFYSNGNISATLDSSGRLLVGTSSVVNDYWLGGAQTIESAKDSLNGITVYAATGFSPGHGSFLGLHRARGTMASPAIVANGDTLGAVYFSSYDGSTYLNSAAIDCVVDGTPGANDMPGRLVFSTTADGASSPTEACRITSNQDLLLSQSGSGIFVGTTVDGAFRIGRSSFAVSTGTLYIGNAAIQVSSDIRLKDNIQDTSLNALEAISKIKVKDFTWSDPSDTSYNNRNARGKWTGLIAQELVDVLPFVVNAPRKEEDGSIDHDSDSIWTLDQSQLCPVLIKAVQQQQEIITALEARLTAAGL
jgi:hypothetical protein